MRATAQVAALAKNAGPAIQRTQLPRQLAAPLMAGNASRQPAAEDKGATAAVGKGVMEEAEEDGGNAADERDPETFDDGEFYQQLLKMFLEGSAGTAAAVASSAALVQVRCRGWFTWSAWVCALSTSLRLLGPPLQDCQDTPGNQGGRVGHFLAGGAFLLQLLV